MWNRCVRWLRARWLWIAGGVGALAIILVLLFPLPLVLVSGRGLDPGQQVTAENDVRAILVQALAGLIVLVGTFRTLHLNREGQITERFTRAIDQLGQTGDQKLDVRLGGIYALERIGRDSRPDRGPVVEVLTAFLREHSQRSHRSDIPSDANVNSGAGTPEQPKLRADLQAVATVLGRSGWSGRHRFDLQHVDLRNADLIDAHLDGADLRGAHLEGADLSGAHLERANLRDAHLEGANLPYAHLEGAMLGGAHLERACLIAAHLERANLGVAHLEEADLRDAHLEGANLPYAHLEGAMLAAPRVEGLPAHLKGGDPRAHLEGANLRAAHLEGARLARAHLEQADLRDAHLEGVVWLD
jgi:uncharacterized protein YjbI with pentapeptide repeats